VSPTRLMALSRSRDRERHGGHARKKTPEPTNTGAADLSATQRAQRPAESTPRKSPQPHHPALRPKQASPSVVIAKATSPRNPMRRQASEEPSVSSMPLRQTGGSYTGEAFSTPRMAFATNSKDMSVPVPRTASATKPRTPSPPYALGVQLGLDDAHKATPLRKQLVRMGSGSLSGSLRVLRGSNPQDTATRVNQTPRPALSATLKECRVSALLTKRPQIRSPSPSQFVPSAFAFRHLEASGMLSGPASPAKSSTAKAVSSPVPSINSPPSPQESGVPPIATLGALGMAPTPNAPRIIGRSARTPHYMGATTPRRAASPSGSATPHRVASPSGRSPSGTTTPRKVLSPFGSTVAAPLTSSQRLVPWVPGEPREPSSASRSTRGSAVAAALSPRDTSWNWQRHICGMHGGSAVVMPAKVQSQPKPVPKEPHEGPTTKPRTALGLMSLPGPLDARAGASSSSEATPGKMPARPALWLPMASMPNLRLGGSFSAPAAAAAPSALSTSVSATVSAAVPAAVPATVPASQRAADAAAGTSVIVSASPVSSRCLLALPGLTELAPPPHNQEPSTDVSARLRPSTVNP